MAENSLTRPIWRTRVAAARALRQRFLLVRNPRATAAAMRLCEAVTMRLAALGAAVRSIAVDDPAAAAAAAAQALAVERFDAVLVAGGDGAARQLAPALVAAECPLGLIPTGAANALALELGLFAVTPERLAGLLMAAPTAPIPWGRANGEPFLLIAGAGLDGHAARLSAPLKPALGRFAYHLGIAGAWLEKGPPLEVRVDGRTHRARWAAVTAARLGPRSLLGGAALMAILCEGGRRVRALQLAALAAGRLDRAPLTQILAFNEVRIAGAAPVAAQADGEPIGLTPLLVRAEPVPVQVITPAAAG